jgi:hypothetical protein
VCGVRVIGKGGGVLEGVGVFVRVAVGGSGVGDGPIVLVGGIGVRVAVGGIGVHVAVGGIGVHVGDGPGVFDGVKVRVLVGTGVVSNVKVVSTQYLLATNTTLSPQAKPSGYQIRPRSLSALTNSL